MEWKSNPPKCEYCSDTAMIDDWRVWMKAWRSMCAMPGQEWTKRVSREELLQVLRDIRDGWRSAGGCMHYEFDCPICMYKQVHIEAQKLGVITDFKITQEDLDKPTCYTK